MSRRDISHWAHLPRPPQAVWDFITSREDWDRWWWSEDALTGVVPGWELGAHLVFGSGWSPTVKEWLPPSILAFGGHRFQLSDAGEGETRLDWTYSREVRAVDPFDPMFAVEQEVEGRLQTQLSIALRALAEALETSGAYIQVRPSAEAGPSPTPPSSREVRVFVSSTFRDMAAERDELSKRAFVELRRTCEERGVVWTDVDLRWGITDEQKAEGQVLPICLTEVENCRPYFLGILGERYGWVPHELPRDEVLRQPWLAEDPGRSVTELEIVHGVLRNPEMAEHAFFYLRDPEYVQEILEGRRGDYLEGPLEDEVRSLGRTEAVRRAEERRRRLAALKERIRTSGFPVRRYRTPEALGALVVEDLNGVLDRLYPLESAPGPAERTARIQDGVVTEAKRGYVPRAELFERLDEHVRGQGPPLVVSGEAGSGKSALLANWAAAYRKGTPADPVLLHFVGASPESASWDGALRHLLAEATRHLGLELELPDHPEALRRTFAGALHASAALGRSIWIIDGLDQLEDRNRALDLLWLPPEVPPGIRMILSTGPGRPLEELARRGWPRLEIEPLTSSEQRRLVEGYLALYRKTLSDEHLARILESPNARDPLFLRTLLEELRLHGEHRTLGGALDEYLASSGTAELFGKVLDRFQRDYERDRPGLVHDALAFLWTARHGLTEDELLELLGSDGGRLPQAVWAPLHRAAGHLLANRSGYLGLRYRSLRQAVAEQFLPAPDQRVGARHALARYFRSRATGIRRLEELPWQLARGRQWDELAHLLTDLDVLVEAWDLSSWDVKRYWADLESYSSHRMVEAYRDVADDLATHGRVIEVLATLLGETGHWEPALRLQESLAHRASADGDPVALMRAQGNRAHMLRSLGRWDEALELFADQEALARRLGRRSGRAAALGGQAGIERVRGHLDAALRLYQEEERVRRKLDDAVGLQYCLGNQAQVRVERSELDQAMELRREQERICREIGQVDGLRIALESQAVILRMKRDLEGALLLSRKAEELCRELGDRPSLATTLSNQGIILLEQGDADRALPLFRGAEEICREVGGRQDLAVALNNQATIRMTRGELDAALRLLEEVAEISRSLGYAMGLQAALHNQARIHVNQGAAPDALALLEEQETLCRDTGYPLGLAQCLNLKGTALSLLGRQAEAGAAWEETRRLVEEHGLS